MLVRVLDNESRKYVVGPMKDWDDFLCLFDDDEESYSRSLREYASERATKMPMSYVGDGRIDFVLGYSVGVTDEEPRDDDRSFSTLMRDVDGTPMLADAYETAEPTVVDGVPYHDDDYGAVRQLYWTFEQVTARVSGNHRHDATENSCFVKTRTPLLFSIDWVASDDGFVGTISDGKPFGVTASDAYDALKRALDARRDRHEGRFAFASRFLS